MYGEIDELVGIDLPDSMPIPPAGYNYLDPLGLDGNFGFFHSDCALKTVRRQGNSSIGRPLFLEFRDRNSHLVTTTKVTRLRYK